MGRGKLKGKSGAQDRKGGPIKSGLPVDALRGLFCFSLKFYDATHPKFRCEGRDDDYFRALLDRMKALSRENVTSLMNRKSDTGFRFHPINFGEERVSESGFGIARLEAYDDVAWQFSLTVNEHGRVHGFMIENVFYVVWLDPDHRLYPRD